MSRGGRRVNSGRKSKHHEKSREEVLINSLKELYQTDCDEQAKKELVKELAATHRGRLFIAESLFGKPTQKVEQTNTTATASVLTLTSEEFKQINND